MAKTKLVQKMTGTEIVEVPEPAKQRFAIFGKDAFSNFKERRIECVSLPEAKRHAELWWKNGGQDVRIVVEEARPGIVWQEVSSERIH